MLKDLMDQRHPTLQPINHKSQNPPPPPAPSTKKKIKLSNKLKVSPLNQELRSLEPITPKRIPNFMKEPALTKYSHREVIIPKSSKVSPSTHIDMDKPRLMNK